MTYQIAPFSSDLPFGRRRMLAIGQHHADLAAAIREGGFEAALKVVALMGGATQRMSIARDLLKAVLATDSIPAKRIEHNTRFGRDEYIVFTPYLTWKFQGSRQRGRIEWMPMIVVSRRPSKPAIAA